MSQRLQMHYSSTAVTGLRSVPQRPRKTVFGGRFSLLNDRGVFHATEMTFPTWRHFEK